MNWRVLFVVLERESRMHSQGSLLFFCCFRHICICYDAWDIKKRKLRWHVEEKCKAIYHQSSFRLLLDLLSKKNMVHDCSKLGEQFSWRFLLIAHILILFRICGRRLTSMLENNTVWMNRNDLLGKNCFLWYVPTLIGTIIRS